MFKLFFFISSVAPRSLPLENEHLYTNNPHRQPFTIAIHIPNVPHESGRGRWISLIEVPMAVGSRMLDFDVWFRFDIGSHCSDGHLCWVPVGAKKKPPPPESKVEECGTVSATKSPGAFFSHRHPRSNASTLDCRGRGGGLCFRTNRSRDNWLSAKL